MTLAPGLIRDSIVEYLATPGIDAAPKEIHAAVVRSLGDVPTSSVRSYLNNNTPLLFERTTRGRYRLRENPALVSPVPKLALASAAVGRAWMHRTDAFQWLEAQEPRSIHAVVTDPPYGLVEFSPKEKAKLRAGRGGVWRVPPSFDGHQRAPLPRFTTLTEDDHRELSGFFRRLGVLLGRVLVPGANVVIASNPLLVHIVATAMTAAGLEMRGYLSRHVMTMRGGDRPKNAHVEFADVSVMPRSQWEPWVVLRMPLEGRVQDNLRRWKTGGFRRVGPNQPFGDVIKSGPTSKREKDIAPHPSLKPQALMRHIVRAALPLGEGVVLDPFMGGGSTIAAANAVGYDSIGLELDQEYFDLATGAVPKLAEIKVQSTASVD